ncbi:smr domain containing protein [Ophiostoma piceae UAMH 11346]|uniref:Smr domain containing protein n=1 Tax=Ophiostoma piceae (strain UAMH 11346) TaxID=1262450 RepID=S3CVK2_OPHP1|nr:smr domain containing protein [Ophiostoma piceae UAMH 11346]
MGKKKGKAAQTQPEAPPSRTKEEEMEDLLNEFRARVDEPLIILFHDELGFEGARQTLTGIAANVFMEESSGFDPSGLQNETADSSPGIVGSSEADSSSRTESRKGDGRSPSRLTTATSDADSGPLSPTASIYGGSYDGWRGGANDSPTDSCDIMVTLRAAFPGLKDIDIKNALKKSDGDMDKASDYLLNITYLEETSQRPKGVDGFFANGDFRPGSKRRVKNAKQKQPKTDQVPVSYKLKPLALEEDDGGGASSGHQQTSRSTLTLSSEDQRQNLAVILHHREIGSQSYESARDLFRRGRSDPLFRQAAVVYTERSQEHHKTARLHESIHSDSIVAGQSAGNKIDLHNVPVLDGVRNALARTQLWWSSLGEDAIRKARENPLQVVTGIGRHSASGSSPMYSQVGRALRDAGWKVQDGIGHYIVTGKKI